MTILLVRHAESAANAGQSTSDPALIPLTDKGRQQARALSLSLAGRPDLIITSPFCRAIDTSKPTAARFRNVGVQQWNIGEFTYLDPASCVGTTAADRKARVDAYWQAADPWFTDGPGAESFAGFVERVRVAMDGFRRITGTAIVFGHGQVMQAMRWLTLREHLSITRDEMQLFRAYDLGNPINNCAMIHLDLK
ncbi:histidine phosphatase family protein [Pseudomonas sp. PhalM4]